MAYIVVGNNRGPRGLKGDIGPMGGFKTGLAVPADLLTAYGNTYEGSYRVATDAAAAAINGRPPGALAGNVAFFPLGSGASIIVWRNEKDGREWQRSVGSSPEHVTDWVETMRKGTKRVVEPLTLARSASVDTTTDVGVRIPFNVPAKPGRWRVHMRNRNERTNTNYPGALDFTGVTIGKGKSTFYGRPTGEFDGGKFPVSAAFTSPADGAQWVSPWLDYALVPNQEYVLSFGYTSAPGVEKVSTVGGGFLINGGSIGINSDVAALTQVSSIPMDVWIVFEVDEDVPQYGYLGDSLTAGLSADLPVYDSWAKRHAHSHGAFAQIYAYSGTGYVEWNSDLKPGINRWVTFGGVRKPDKLYNAMGSNDLVTADLPAMIARFDAAMAAIRKVICSNIIHVTVLPRFDDPVFEANRKAWNKYLVEQVPGGALMTIEAATALEDATGGVLDPRWRAAPTDIHLNYAGYARYAAQLN